MFKDLQDVSGMSKEEAQKRIKELNREIRKHEIAFVLFVVIGITQIVLSIIGLVPIGFVTLLTTLGCGLACIKIYLISEPFELEKYFIELIFGKNGK